MASPLAWPITLVGLVLVSAGCSGKRMAPMPDPAPAIPAFSSENAPATESPSTSAGSAAAGRRAILEQRIHFEYDQWRLTAEAKSLLESKAVILREEPELTIRVEGHADERGSDEYNMVLSQQRAAEVKRHLAALGIAESRIATTALGEEQPLATGSGESAWALNRRAEFRITASR